MITEPPVQVDLETIQIPISVSYRCPQQGFATQVVADVRMSLHGEAVVIDSSFHCPACDGWHRANPKAISEILKRFIQNSEK